MYRLIFAAVIAFLPVAANAQPTSAPPATSTPEARIAIPPGWYLVPTTLLNRVFTLVQMDGGAASTLLGNDIGACIRAASGSRITMAGVPQPCASDYDAAVKTMADAQAAIVHAAAEAATAAQKAAGTKEMGAALAKQKADFDKSLASTIAAQKAEDEKAAVGKVPLDVPAKH